MPNIVTNILHHILFLVKCVDRLQVTAHTLSKLTTSFPQIELRPLLEELHNVQKQAKKYDIIMTSYDIITMISQT